MPKTTKMPEDRIALLRQRCFERKIQALRYPLIATAESFKNTEDIPSLDIRCGLRTRKALASLEFEIDELELLAGRPRREQIEADEEAFQKAEKYLNKNLPCGGQTGHCELDLSKLFELGIDSLIEYIQRFEQNNARKAFGSALEGFSRMIENLAVTVESEIPAASETRKKESAEIAASCRRIAHTPPANFRDALQLLWLADLAVMYGENVSLVVPGRLDRILWRYYSKDIQSGELTKAQALELIESLYVLINEAIPDGLAVSVMIGGCDSDGNDVTNELSYLCMEAVRKTGMIYPTVGVCWNEQTPDDLVDLTVGLIAEGYTTPAFFGDKTIRKGLESYGLNLKESHNYINSTCVEITPVGSSNVWVASPYLNLCQLLLDELNDQAALSANNFQDFFDTCITKANKEIYKAAETQNRLRKLRYENSGKPLQSVFTRDCIQRGKDIDRGGALHNWVECSFVGMANICDSMVVIKHEIFDEQNLTLAELRDVLEANFEHAEVLRQRFMNYYPKYGQADEEVDSLVKAVASCLINACSKHKMFPDDSSFIPGMFCWIMHERLGRETGATPDGRLAGFPFADGGGPAQGREIYGPTAGILSTTSWDHAAMIGGLAYNMKFAKRLFETPKSRKSLKYLILTYLRKGGFETQINVLDRRTLLEAQKNPEQYRDLIVRIGGYCDYFVKLSSQMQAEVILRTEFDN
jgi:formate C-acetyltransferase